MGTKRNKVQLSPRLKLGVGRRAGPINLIEYLSIAFLLVGAGLAVRAGYLVLNKSGGNEQPQVLGAQTTNDSNQLFAEHKVKKGETVFSISQQYNIEWTILATINNLNPPFALKPNQTLKIPLK